jgi:hypothetical protein
MNPKTSFSFSDSTLNHTTGKYCITNRYTTRLRPEAWPHIFLHQVPINPFLVLNTKRQNELETHCSDREMATITVVLGRKKYVVLKNTTCFLSDFMPLVRK